MYGRTRSSSTVPGRLCSSLLLSFAAGSEYLLLPGWLVEASAVLLLPAVAAPAAADGAPVC
jgi:hypothetical protein